MLVMPKIASIRVFGFKSLSKIDFSLRQTGAVYLDNAYLKYYEIFYYQRHGHVRRLFISDQFGFLVPTITELGLR